MGKGNQHGQLCGVGTVGRGGVDNGPVAIMVALHPLDADPHAFREELKTGHWLWDSIPVTEPINE